MNIHIFNPEHDIALAYNRPHLTVPHAAQELRMNLGWIPAIWANDGDVVLVEDVPFAVKAASRHKEIVNDVLFLGWDEVRGMDFECVQPWGWDKTLRTMLVEAGLNDGLLPSTNELEIIRSLSSRWNTIDATKALRLDDERQTCGISLYVTDISQITKLLLELDRIVVKAPWSSSGRGIRYIEGNVISESVWGFIRNTIHLQGGIMVEPLYNKVLDFGMEFEVNVDGSVSYGGLSLFQTMNGTYTGSILATEDEKMEMLGKYVDKELINSIKRKVCEYFSVWLRDRYVGPFGIDMMIVASHEGKGFLLHPCVEINLRRTMGHVALALSPKDGLIPKRIMQIIHDVNYKLKISPYENNYVQTF